MNENQPISRKQDIIMTLVVIAIIVVVAAGVLWPGFQPGFL